MLTTTIGFAIMWPGRGRKRLRGSQSQHNSGEESSSLAHSNLPQKRRRAFSEFGWPAESQTPRHAMIPSILMAWVAAVGGCIYLACA